MVTDPNEKESLMRTIRISLLLFILVLLLVPFHINADDSTSSSSGNGQWVTKYGANGAPYQEWIPYASGAGVEYENILNNLDSSAQIENTGGDSTGIYSVDTDEELWAAITGSDQDDKKEKPEGEWEGMSEEVAHGLLADMMANVEVRAKIDEVSDKNTPEEKSGDVKTALEEAKEELEELKEDKKAKLPEIEDRLDEIEDEAEECKEKRDKVENEINKVKSELDSLKADRDEALREVNDLINEGKHEEAKEKLAEFSETGTQAKIDTLTNELDSLYSEDSKLVDHANSLEHEATALKSQAEEINEDIAEKEGEIDLLEGAVAMLEYEIENSSTTQDGQTREADQDNSKSVQSVDTGTTGTRTLSLKPETVSTESATTAILTTAITILDQTAVTKVDGITSGSVTLETRSGERVVQTIRVDTNNHVTTKIQQPSLGSGISSTELRPRSHRDNTTFLSTRELIGSGGSDQVGISVPVMVK